MSGGRNRADTKYLVAAEVQSIHLSVPKMAVIRKTTKSPYLHERFDKKDRHTTQVLAVKPEELEPEHFHTMNKARDILALSDKAIDYLNNKEVIWKGIITREEYERRHTILATAEVIGGKLR